MNTNSLNETGLTEVLQIMQDGESNLKEMSDYATTMAENWRTKAYSQKNDKVRSLRNAD